jgi:signal transduction histidine kinase
MVRLRFKLSLFNLASKVVFTALFLLLMPTIVRKISLIQTDNNLIQMREQVISLISKVGIEPFINLENQNSFGSFNILKEEFISLEKYDKDEDVNFIEVTQMRIENDDITYRILNYSFKVDGVKYLLEVGKSLESIQYTEKNTRTVMLLFLALIILLTFFTDQLYTQKLLIPLDIITGKLKNISDPSVYDKNPVKTTTSDFIKLDNALKELMDHIDLLFRKEKEITVNISHELLTPVSILRSKLENLLIREDISPEITSRIDESLKTLHRLQTLINSLLMIARLESRQYLRDDTFPINDVLNEIVSELDPVAEDSGVILKKELEESFQVTKANRALIFSMFYNVVNNALKNSSRDGVVVIKSSSIKGSHKIIISDTGKGFLADQLVNLFSRFKTRNEINGTGTGIGLAIAKSIADFHEIIIFVTSEKNKGTIFSFLFPVIS